jgi:lauroyl/myristoyl acyltransferase
MVGLVADRLIGHSRGARVELFGAPARLPLGPAALSVATGAPIWLQAVERLGPGRWVGHTVAIEGDPGATGRAATRSILAAEARAFERIVARAPEQWSTLFFAIWDSERPAS